MKARAGARRRRQRLTAALLCAACLLACRTDSELIADHIREAEALAQAGQPLEALTELRNALRLDPQSADLNLRLGRLLEDQEQFADAIFFYGEAQRLDPAGSEAPLREARLLVFDDPERSAELANAVLEREPESAQALIVLSRLALIATDVDEALRRALTAVELAGDASAYLQLGKVHQARILERQLKKQPADDSLYERALGVFDRAIELGSGDTVVRAQVERTRLMVTWKGHEAQAAESCRLAIAAALTSHLQAPKREILKQCQNFAARSGDRELVRFVLEQRVAVFPEDLDAWSALARFEQAASGGAQRVLERMIASRPDDARAHIRYARFLARAGDIDAAASHLEAVAERDLEPAEVLGALVRMLTAAGLRERANALGDRLAREYPEHPVTVLARARRALVERRLDAAATDLQRLTGSVERFDAYLLLADVERLRGDRRAALEAVGKAIDLVRGQPIAAAALRLRSELQAEVGSCDAALQGLSALASASGLAPRDRVLQAHCLYEIDRPEVARSVLRVLLAGDAPNLRAVVEFADREAGRDPERVRALLDKALERQPTLAPLLLRAARLDLREGQAQRALDRLDRAISAGATSVALLMERARVRATRGDLAGAQEDALRAFEASPGQPGAGALLLALYRAQGRSQEVIDSFEEALAAGALPPPARALLSKLHLQSGNAERAREIQEALLAENLDMPGVKNDVAYRLAQAGEDLDRALELAQQAQRSLPRSAEVADTLGYVYLQRGLHGPALEQFRYALGLAAIAPDSDRALYPYHEGLALRAMNRPEEAAAAFERALVLDPEHAEARDALREVRSVADAPDLPGTSS